MVLEQLNLNKFIMLIALGNIEFANSIRPELVALIPSILLKSASADDHGYVLLNDHLPKVISGTGKRTLGSNDFFITHHLPSFLPLERRVHKASIDVVSFMIGRLIDSVFENHSGVFVRQNVTIPVPVDINPVSHQVGIYRTLFVELLQETELLVDVILVESLIE